MEFSLLSSTSIPATFAFSSSSPSSNPFRFPKTQTFSFIIPTRARHGFHLVKSFAQSPSALRMEAPTTQHNGGVLPELLTEFMVDMKCEGCVSAVKNKLQTVDGVKNIDADLTNQVVRVLGTSPVKVLTEALEQTGRKARLIGQGVPEGIFNWHRLNLNRRTANFGLWWLSILPRPLWLQSHLADFLISAAVGEFKGPDIFGVVRFAQVNMELARIEANFSGLSAGKHVWSINEFGDLTRGATSTGKIFNPKAEETMDKPLGDLGTLEVDEKGEAFFSGVKEKLRVADLMGRSVVLYRTEDKSEAGIEAAVIARSAGVGENYKKLCTCDGTVIWESSSNDFVTASV